MDDRQDPRQQRLAKHFLSVVKGRKTLTTSRDSILFLESIVAQPQASTCVEQIVANPAGLTALQLAIRCDVSPQHLNNNIASFLKYLQDPAVKILVEGQLLKTAVKAIIEPPTLWYALLNAHKLGLLNEDATQGLAWLLLEALSSDESKDFYEVAREVTSSGVFTSSQNVDIRTLGHKIKHTYEVLTGVVDGGTVSKGESSPGGRHDNDFVDFRQISILPTSAELSSKEEPYLRLSGYLTAEDEKGKAAVHLDNQFRLLREDFLGELRSDIQAARTSKKSWKSTCLKDITFDGVTCGALRRRRLCGLKLRCKDGLNLPGGWDATPKDDRIDYLKKNKNIVRHQSIGCLLNNGEIVAFGNIDRDEDLLVEKIVVLQIRDESALMKALIALKTAPKNALEVLIVDTAFFSYEPVLKRLQEQKEFPLAEELVHLRRVEYDNNNDVNNLIFETVFDGEDMLQLIGIQKKFSLDKSQQDSIIAALESRVSLIQGPPGTGKSFVGSLLAKILFDKTTEKILVICYTNHALDQFLEDLMDIGIPEDDIVRLGSKSTAKTEPLMLKNKTTAYVKKGKDTFALINELNNQVDTAADDIYKQAQRIQIAGVSFNDLMEYLEFEAQDYHSAFELPTRADGMKVVGKGGKALADDYLFNCWRHCQVPSHGAKVAKEGEIAVWSLPRDKRLLLIEQWTATILEEKYAGFYTKVASFNNSFEKAARLRREQDSVKIRGHRIIGCTTTAAAMYTADLQVAQPTTVLVEEAGEILESHIIAAMGPSTQRLILIGDHKQLRPKANSYKLSVEKGDGYDLNLSMFERLVRGGLEHTTLLKQHRMNSEISCFVRQLTYKDLVDGPGTQDRPSLRGFQSRVMFVQHEKPEKNANKLKEKRIKGETTSKENQYEVLMVLKCVRYLAQQGYGTQNIVILTPYLGQLFLLREELKKDHDPILNDLDSHDLIQAGIMGVSTAKVGKKPIKLSTIDNYQGEESDIVIATLTRSNAEGEIGFMAAPQRLNVLISRARDALILIGNASTFLKSKKGADTWRPFIDILKEKNQIFDGFPVRCERHPDKMLLLKEPQDFMDHCPDGGCNEPCGKKLKCDHDCPKKCHKEQDHSKMECGKIMDEDCGRGHKIKYKCGKDKTCRICTKEKAALVAKVKRDMDLEKERAEKAAKYQAQLAALDDEIDLERRKLVISQDEERFKQELADKKQALESTKKMMASVKNNEARQAAEREKAEKSRQSAPKLDFKAGMSLSEAEQDWEHQKKYDNAYNDSLDSLMKMIGLEDVKAKFLNIRSKVDTLARQNANMKNERFGVALLGNPGTGKTTVARLYAKFLTSFGVIPGDHFIETTGSRLTNDGVPGCKKHIEDILNAGGGAFFIDEAYQLVTGNGTQVLDFLLAEMENQTGKIVFILAGYNKEMEKFFQHNPGIPSRIPHQLQFADYTDPELLRILQKSIHDKYSGAMQMEAGLDGKYLRIAARRVGRGRGREGFGNARAIQNLLSTITERQADRIRREKRKKQNSTPDYYFLTKEDMIGPEPSKAVMQSDAWTKLQKMIGLKAVKQAVKTMVDILQTNYRLELEEKPIIECSLNKVFTGSPGTGKTTVAKLYGKILVDIGLLTSAEVVVKNPSDFIGSALGQSEQNTKAILASTEGKVLVIDEAYSLCGSSSDDSSLQTSDPYRTAVIDTLVAEVQSTTGENRCVLLLGYRDQMEKMFQKVNPGLARRFPLASAFEFEDFTDEEMGKIFDLKIKSTAFGVTPAAKNVAMEVVRRARNRLNFGNAGEIDILLDRAKQTHQKRLSAGKSTSLDVFEPEDFDEEYDRGKKASTDINKLFEGTVGMEELIAKLKGYQEIVESLRERDIRPEDMIPFNFLFTGPPGTGKTTTARKMGKVYYDMGLLSTAEVVDLSASNIIGKYVGQTGPLVRETLDKALGKVLFLDEAYRLAEKSQFAEEAVGELVDCLTKPRYAGKLIVILGGYEEQINELLQVNPGLSSRFPETISFKPLSPQDSVALLINKLKSGKRKVDISAVSSASKTEAHELFGVLQRLSETAGWGNARDILTLSKDVFMTVLRAAAPKQKLKLEMSVLLDCAQKLETQRIQRSSNALPSDRKETLPIMEAPPRTFKPPRIGTATTIKTAPAEVKLDEAQATKPDLRDAGVTDEIWHQLQRDKALAAFLGEAQTTELQRISKEMQEAKIKKDEQEYADVKNEIIEAEYEAERKRQEEIIRKLEEERRRIEEERKREAAVQRKLASMGVCVAGFNWIKQGNGYRCAGGSHFISNGQLGL